MNDNNQQTPDAVLREITSEWGVVRGVPGRLDSLEASATRLETEVKSLRRAALAMISVVAQVF